MNKKNEKIPLSFEFFSPKTEAGFLNLEQAQRELASQSWQPQYFSVTYGAGGTTQEGSLRIIENSINQFVPISIVPHLTCIGAKKIEIAKLLDHFLSLGIKQLVILRGDLPFGTIGSLGEFKYASQLVSFIQTEYQNQFHITVAAYPEMHPEAKNLIEDLNYFCEKVNAGAASAITQFFFNLDSYEYFVSRCKEQGVTIPIIPGIMPINILSQLQRFASQCGSEIPRWLINANAGMAEEQQKQLGLELVINLCHKLINIGAPGLHFYTLNRSQLTLQIINKIINKKSD